MENNLYAKYIVEKEKEKMLNFEKIDFVVANFINIILQSLEKSKCIWYENYKYVVIPVKCKNLLGNKHVKIVYNFNLQNLNILTKCNFFNNHLFVDKDTPFFEKLEKELNTNGFNLIEIIFSDLIYGGDYCVCLEVIQ